MINVLYVVIRILLGLIFVVSGYEKAVTPHQNFLYILQAYKIVPLFLENIVAIIFPWVELMIGIFVVFGLWLRSSLIAMAIMFCCFIFIISQALLRGLDLSECGYFGALISIPPSLTLLFDVILLCLTLLILKKNRTFKMFQFRSICLVLLAIFSVIICDFNVNVFAQNLIKEPNVAGSFYNEDGEKLSTQLSALLSQAQISAHTSLHPKIIIAPHAGYRYSGHVAAHAYASIPQGIYKTVIVISPSHYFAFEGVSVWENGGFRTPLGIIPIEEKLTRQFLDYDDIFSYQAHVFEKEHGLETQLPFIQKVLPEANIVPMIIGRPHLHVVKRLAEALDYIIGNRDDVLIVVSADLSHYHSYQEAVQLDQHSIDAILQFKNEAIWQESLERTMEIDAFHAVLSVLMYAQKKGYEPTLLKYANSGDVGGDQSRVVGYAAIVFNDHAVNTNADILTKVQQQKLISIARNTIDLFVRTGKHYHVDVDDSRLLRQEGAFVTVNKNHRLRGCIGHIVSQQSLVKTIQDVSIAAVSEDPRFNPVSIDELEDIDIEISVLSRPQQIENLDKIVLGKHGVIISKGPQHRGVFLPQVANETGWGKEEFLSQLASQKAGLPADAWKDPSTKIEIFTAQVFREID